MLGWITSLDFKSQIWILISTFYPRFSNRGICNPNSSCCSHCHIRSNFTQTNDIFSNIINIIIYISIHQTSHKLTTFLSTHKTSHKQIKYRLHISSNFNYYFQHTHISINNYLLNLELKTTNSILFSSIGE